MFSVKHLGTLGPHMQFYGECYIGGKLQAPFL